MELNGGAIIIERPRLFEGKPVPSCDIIVKKWDGSIVTLLAMYHNTHAIRIENVPKKERPFFVKWGFKSVGPLCDRVMLLEAK